MPLGSGSMVAGEDVLYRASAMTDCDSVRGTACGGFRRMHMGEHERTRGLCCASFCINKDAVCFYKTVDLTVLIPRTLR